jgi:hypothetical protein
METNIPEILKDYLDSECDDYGMNYLVEFNEDYDQFEATIKCNETNNQKVVNFRVTEDKQGDPVLTIELSEDSWYETAEYDYTVKYFWMLVAPAIFPEN